MTKMWQLCLNHSSCDQPCPAVTINDLFPGVTVTINSPKFSTPKIFNIRPAVAVSHDRKNNRSHDSFQAQNGWRKRCRVDTIRDCLNSPYSASVILLIVTAVNSPHKGRRRRASMFSLICTRINSWVNNGEAGELRRHRAHCDVIVMVAKISAVRKRQTFWRKRTNVFFEVEISYNPDKLICILL